MRGSKKRFIIPVYQRNYDWRTENCKQLYDDFIKVIKTIGTVKTEDESLPKQLYEDFLVDKYQPEEKRINLKSVKNDHRSVCELPTNALNKIFLMLHREVVRYNGTAARRGVRNWRRLWGGMGQIATIGAVGRYGITTSEGTKKRPLFQAFFP